VDNLRRIVDNNGRRVGSGSGSGGAVRPQAANAAGHPPVGSSGRPPLPGQVRSRASGRTLEELETLNATSEASLLEGRGICGRCGGTGSVPADDVAPSELRRRSCPRCGGTGLKP